MNVAIAIAIITLALLGKPLLAVAKRAYAALAALLPRVSSLGGIFTASVELPLWKVAALVLAFAMLGQRGCELPKVTTDWKWPEWVTVVVPPGKPLVVMMHEANQGPLPSYAAGAANDLSAAGFEVRMVDDDLLDGTGETPDWLKPALEPGRKIMGGTDGKEHALVLVRGDKVNAVKLPATRELIIGAVK